MFATRQRACSGYLLEYNDVHVWLDAGGGTWRELLSHVDYEKIDAIVLSHKHPDHTIDVFQAFHARMYGQSERLPRIPLYAPRETAEMLPRFSEDITQSYDVQVISEDTSQEIAGAKWSFVRMAHPPETLGMRVEADGATFAYSADSGSAADFTALAGGADLFVCEATFQDSDEPWEGHLSASDAGSIARQVEAADLLLTHLPPGRDHGLSLAQAERTAGDVAVRLAADGLQLEV